MKSKFQEYEHVIEANKMKKELGRVKRETKIKAKCNNYEVKIKDIKRKVENNAEKYDEACSESKLMALKNI